MCKEATDELVRLRDEHEKLKISNAELYNDLGDLEAHMGTRPQIEDVLNVMRANGWEEHSPAHPVFPLSGGSPKATPRKRCS